jgi:hypothetical protein
MSQQTSFPGIFSPLVRIVQGFFWALRQIRSQIDEVKRLK